MRLAGEERVGPRLPGSELIRQFRIMATSNGEVTEMQEDLKGSGLSVSPLPSFRGHRTKPSKMTFSERQRQRRAGELAGSTKQPAAIGHRLKSKMTFSERQRLRKKGYLQEQEALDCVDGVDGAFIGSWPDYVDERTADEDDVEPNLAAAESSGVEQSGPGIVIEQACVPSSKRTRFRIRLGLNPITKKLLSGAIAGGFSRTGEFAHK